MRWAWFVLAVLLAACQSSGVGSSASQPAKGAQATSASTTDEAGAAAVPGGDATAERAEREKKGASAGLEPGVARADTRDADAIEPGPAPDEVAAQEPAAPQPLTAPDGTVMAPCGGAPEGMSCVDGGPFVRGSDDDPHIDCKAPSYIKRGESNTTPAQKVWLQTFYMDRTEVTFEAYKACEESGKCEKAGPLYRDFSRPNQPITGVSWYHADGYCRAVGKHLPTEAQWEKAARGPDGEMYPWGDAPSTCELAVIMNEEGKRSCGTEKNGDTPEKGRVLEVCSRPAGRYELCDMIGNVEEWVADWYAQSYASCGEDCVGVDPLGPCGGGGEKCQGHRYKIIRGGSWYWPAEHATSIHRRTHKADNKPFHHFGFRCAASLQEAEALGAARPSSDPTEETKGETPDAQDAGSAPQAPAAAQPTPPQGRGEQGRTDQPSAASQGGAP